jgi:hypothetical protein
VATNSSSCRLELGAAREDTCKASRAFTRSKSRRVEDGWVVVRGVVVEGVDEQAEWAARVEH